MRVLVCQGLRLVMACCRVLVGELFIPLAWCGEGDIGFACPAPCCAYQGLPCLTSPGG